MNKKVISVVMAAFLAASGCTFASAATTAATKTAAAKTTTASNSADVIVSITVGIGETKSLDSYIKEGATVIDVGMNRKEDGNYSC